MTWDDITPEQANPPLYPARCFTAGCACGGKFTTATERQFERGTHLYMPGYDGVEHVITEGTRDGAVVLVPIDHLDPPEVHGEPIPTA